MTAAKDILKITNSQPIPTTTAKDRQTVNKTLFTVVNLLDENTVEYFYGMLLENLFGDNTKEAVCGILMETLSSQDDIVVDGVGICDRLFELVDIDKTQQQ